MKIILVLVLILFPAVGMCLSEDSNGWSVITPSATSALAYVDATSGNDGTGQTYTTAQVGNDPMTPDIGVNAYQTIAAAMSAVQSGDGDWVLLKCGEEWDESINWDISGKDADEYAVLTHYYTGGSCSALPHINQTSTGTALRLDDPLSYIAIRGINFYPTVRDPDHGDFTEPTPDIDGFRIEVGIGDVVQYVLIEGNVFRFFDDNTIQDTDDSVIEIKNITLRRNTILDNWNDADHSQGLYMLDVEDILIEENIFDHNGWYSQSPATPGEAVIHNHNIYTSDTKNLTIKENILSRASSQDLKFASEGGNHENLTIENNFIFDGEIGISLGDDGSYINVSVLNNVLFNIGESQPTGRTLAYAIAVLKAETVDINGNIIAWNDNASVTDVRNIRWGTYNASNLTIRNNVTYETGGVAFYNIDSGGVATGSSVSSNKFQEPTGTDEIVFINDTDENGITFSSNKYYSNASAGQEFYRNSANLSFEAWVSATGDTSSWEQVNFPDVRSVTDYMSHIGGTETKAAFIAGFRAQSYINWNTNYETDTVNDWIRAGFGLYGNADITIGGGSNTATIGGGSLTLTIP